MAENKFLTRAEHQIMVYLWNLKDKGGFTNDILACYEEPRPAYTTLATFLKILTKKEFVKANKVGSMLYYTPKVSQRIYCKHVMKKAQDDYFQGDAAAFIKFIAEINKLTDEQKEEIKASL